MFKLVSSLAGVLFVVGCGQHPVQEAIALQENFADELCDCPDIVNDGYMGSRAACLATVGPTLTQAEIDCIEAVYDRNESAVASPYSCTIDLAKDARDCIESASCNPVALDACAELLDLESCPQIPPSVDAEFEACRS